MKLLATATALCLVCAPALANEPTEKDAIAMAERGAAMVKAKGKEEVMKRISAKDPDFVQGSLYIDMRDVKTGIVLAHPYNPSIVGKDLTDVPDANGKKYRREIIELAAAKRQDRAEDHLHPAGRRRGAGSRFVQEVNAPVATIGSRAALTALFHSGGSQPC
jgi:hypothetical protein